LILAGETVPSRSGAAVGSRASDPATGDSDESASQAGQSAQRVTFISARVDAIVTQGYNPPANSVVVASSTAQLPMAAGASYARAVSPTLHQVYTTAARGSSSGGASAYARTRDLSDRVPAIIDTYA
jgi:hypothetical protein